MIYQYIFRNKENILKLLLTGFNTNTSNNNCVKISVFNNNNNINSNKLIFSPKQKQTRNQKLRCM